MKTIFFFFPQKKWDKKPTSNSLPNHQAPEQHLLAFFVAHTADTLSWCARQLLGGEYRGWEHRLGFPITGKCFFTLFIPYVRLHSNAQGPQEPLKMTADLFAKELVASPIKEGNTSYPS